MSKTALFFGSFNPVHIGHIIIANHIVEMTNVEELWFVVSPQNPFKEKKTLLSENQRFQMLFDAIQPYPKMKASKVEFSLPKPSYTVDTISYLIEQHPEREFVLIMGEDNLKNLHKWKNYQQLLSLCKVMYYPRIHEDSDQDYKVLKEHAHVFERIDAPRIEISSTQIRQMISEGKNYRPLLPIEVYKFISGSNIYK